MTREKAGNERTNIFVTNGVFNFELLRLHKFKREKILRGPYSGIKESCPRSSWQVTTRIRRFAAAQILLHEDNNS